MRKILVGIPEKRWHLKYLGADRKIILKFILSKYR
jgi:hypothetical protein